MDSMHLKQGKGQQDYKVPTGSKGSLYNVLLMLHLEMQRSLDQLVFLTGSKRVPPSGYHSCLVRFGVGHSGLLFESFVTLSLCVCSLPRSM